MPLLMPGRLIILWTVYSCRKEDRDAAEKDSETQNATMQPSNDERRADTSIDMHREESGVDRSQEIGLHNTFEDHVGGHTVLEVAAPTDNNEGRAEVDKNTQHKEGAAKRTHHHVLHNAFKERVFGHRMEEATFRPVISAYSLRSTEECDEALAATKHMTAQLLPSFDERLWSGWKRKEEAFSYLEVDLFLKFFEFVEKYYFRIMVETLKANHITIHDDAEDKECGEIENRFRQALKNRTFSHKEEAGRFVSFMSPQS